MDRAAAFLEAIRDAPDDDTPRLIFADWLEEHGGAAGRARAAFVRAQCALARLPADHPARPALEGEARGLLAEHEAGWAAPLAGVAADWEFRRGFVEWAELSDDALLRHGDALFAALPLRDLRLRLAPGRAAAVAGSAHLGRLTRLDLRGSGLRDRPVRDLLASPHLTRLTDLGLADNFLEGPAVQALAESPLLGRLARLDFSGNHTFGDRALRALAAPAGGGPRRLRALGLADTNLTGYGVRDLLLARALAGLEELDLSLGDDPRPVRRSAAFRELGTALGGLTADALPVRPAALDLRGNACGDFVTRVLAPSGRLRRLRLRPGGAVVWALAATPGLSGLTALEAGGVGPDGAAALAESPHLAALTELRLRGGETFAAGPGLRDAGAKALASSPHLARLTVLDLSGNRLGGPGVRAVAESPNFARLTTLSLAGNYVGPPGLRALSASPVLVRLRSLDLGRIHLDADGARVLAEGPLLGRLAELVLAGNRLGDAGVAALAASPHLRGLTSLDLSANGIGPVGADSLTKSPFLACGLRLSLARNDLGDREWHALAARFGRHVVR